MPEPVEASRTITVRPGLLPLLIASLTGLLISLPKALLESGALTTFCYALAVAVSAGIPLLALMLRITVAPAVVTVRKGFGQVSIPVSRLASVCAEAPRAKGASILVLKDDGGTEWRVPLLAVRPGRRRLLVNTLERVAAPGVVRRDGPMNDLLGAASN
ncbi:hypothetical protein OG689_07510 [Kitasatospora sp. NBC_00240]|uniref:hypothetical protein n=1 Tax=Kitasatospora sp. NBC_00240 TaxID=2903567 RepID=UPI002253ED0D|nr:hypothetical protein [Kitasatospora sp. NBC_00240]MCX5209133.1 hypothetical protein [Kitasatospora sp. NBC_00240]